MFRGQFSAPLNLSPVSSLIAVSRTVCSLLILRQIETHVASKAFLPTHPFPPLFHQPAQRYCIFLSLFYSISFMLCFQNSQPFLGLSFRLLYIMCLCVYYSLISNCLQQCRYILWLYLM